MWPRCASRYVSGTLAASALCSVCSLSGLLPWPLAAHSGRVPKVSRELAVQGWKGARERLSAARVGGQSTRIFHLPKLSTGCRCWTTTKRSKRVSTPTGTSKVHRRGQDRRRPRVRSEPSNSRTCDAASGRPWRRWICQVWLRSLWVRRTGCVLLLEAKGTNGQPHSH